MFSHLYSSVVGLKQLPQPQGTDWVAPRPAHFAGEKENEQCIAGQFHFNSLSTAKCLDRKGLECLIKLQYSELMMADELYPQKNCGRLAKVGTSTLYIERGSPRGNGEA